MSKHEDVTRQNQAALGAREQDQPDSSGSVSAEQAKGDVQEQVDEMNRKGFVGVKVDPVPNEEYTLTTGPDSPSTVSDVHTRVEYVSTRDLEERT